MATFVWPEQPNGAIDVPGRPATRIGRRVVPGCLRRKVYFEDGVLQTDDPDVIQAARAAMRCERAGIRELPGATAAEASLALIENAIARTGGSPAHGDPDIDDGFRG